MCGRFAIHADWAEMEEWYDITSGGLPPFPENYNVSPSEPIAVIGCFDERDKFKRALTFVRWGLIPPWWKKSLNELPSSINARGETIKEKPFFRGAYSYRRCLIPVSGFYEWNGNASPKQPYYITAREGALLTLAGIYEYWTEPQSGTEVMSASIVTTEANRFMRSIHKRMPVILRSEDFSRWLNGDYDEVPRQCADNYLQAWPVSTKVNSARYKGEDCIVEVPPDGMLI